jgi:hypothetical protein
MMSDREVLSRIVKYVHTQGEQEFDQIYSSSPQS